MTPTPSGKVFPTAAGLDLVLTRTFSADIGDVWASITEPERTARWFGRWEGEAAPGKTVQLTPAFEEGAEPGDVEIIECEPPSRLVVALASPGESWLIEIELSERDSLTELTFTHHLNEGTPAQDTGPGWEYYLDKLVASRDGSAEPNWDDYYPAMKEHYAG